MRRNRLALALALACAVAAPANARSQAAGGGVLSPGDAVRVTVWRQPELSGEFWIASDSTIGHPLYREVKVAGLPLSAVEDRLRSFLSRLEANPQFVVEPLLRISVAGEVRQPNLYTLRPEVTVAQAVVQAGGLTDRGRLDRARLIRGGQEHLVDLTGAEGSLAQSPIQSGDQIVVDSRSAVLRDYLGPVASVVAVLLGIVNLFAG